MNKFSYCWAGLLYILSSLLAYTSFSPFPPDFFVLPTSLKKISCLEHPSGFKSRDMPCVRHAYFVLRVVFILCHPKIVPPILFPKEPYSSRVGLAV